MLFVLVPCPASGCCIFYTWFEGLRDHGLVRRHPVPRCGLLSSHPLPLLFDRPRKLGRVVSLRMLVLSSRLLSRASLLPSVTPPRLFRRSRWRCV